MATPTYGFDFRATAGFVTDPAYASAVLGEAYPHSYGNGLTAGWGSSTGNTRDRSSSIDARLAGIQFQTNASAGTLTFRVDLPASGKWNIFAAFGDATNAQTQFVTFIDNATGFQTYTNIGTSSGQFMDAAGNLFSSANWPGSNVTITRDFGSTILKVQMGGNGTGGNNTSIAFLGLSQVLPSTDTFVEQLRYGLI